MKNIVAITKLVMSSKCATPLILGSSPLSNNRDHREYDVVTINGAIGLTNEVPWVSFITDAIVVQNNKNNIHTLDQFIEKKCENLIILKTNKIRSLQTLKELEKRKFSYNKVIFFPRFIRSLFFFCLIGKDGLKSGSDKISNGVFIYSLFKFINSSTVYDRITPNINGHGYGGKQSARSHNGADEKVLKWLEKKK